LKFFPLVWAGLWRRPVRTILTAICIVIAFVLLGLLQGVNAGFERAIANAGGDFLITRTRVQGGAFMPVSAMAEIRNVPGVRAVAPRAYFMGANDRSGGPILAAIATRGDIFFGMMRNSFSIGKKELESLNQDRMALVATPELLEVFHWKVGDTVTVRGNTPKTDGTADWVFHITGAFTTERRPSYFAIINYDYFDGARAVDRGTAETFYIQIDDANKAIAASEAVDRIFANSPHESRTMSREARAAAQTKQMGDVRFFTNAIMCAVLFTLAFLTGNTLRQSLQDRSREFAVLKAMGYSGGHVLSLAFAEALLLYLPPAVLGLVGAWLLAPLWQQDFGSIFVSPAVGITGLLCAAALAFIGAALPASSLSRMPVAFALGKR
jgi:putative ABC transport system permease protein